MKHKQENIPSKKKVTSKTEVKLTSKTQKNKVSCKKTFKPKIQYKKPKETIKFVHRESTSLFKISDKTKNTLVKNSFDETADIITSNSYFYEFLNLRVVDFMKLKRSGRKFNRLSFLVNEIALNTRLIHRTTLGKGWGMCQPFLAKKYGVSEASISDWFKELIAHRILIVVNKTYRAGSHTKTYKLSQETLHLVNKANGYYESFPDSEAKTNQRRSAHEKFDMLTYKTKDVTRICGAFIGCPDSMIKFLSEKIPRDILRLPSEIDIFTPKLVDFYEIYNLIRHNYRDGLQRKFSYDEFEKSCDKYGLGVILSEKWNSKTRISAISKQIELLRFREFSAPKMESKRAKYLAKKLLSIRVLMAKDYEYYQGQTKGTEDRFDDIELVPTSERLKHHVSHKFIWSGKGNSNYWNIRYRDKMDVREVFKAEIFNNFVDYQLSSENRGYFVNLDSGDCDFKFLSPQAQGAAIKGTFNKVDDIPFIGTGRWKRQLHAKRVSYSKIQNHWRYGIMFFDFKNQDMLYRNINPYAHASAVEIMGSDLERFTYEVADFSLANHNMGMVV